MTYESFRVLITPNVAQPGTWSVQVLDCPVPGLKNESDTVTPVFTRNELTALRNAAGWPNQNLLRTIGERVWSSVMAPNVKAAYQASRAMLAPTGKGLRVVFVVSGQEANGVTPPAIRLAELPVEALFQNAFVASDVTTPVSRSLVVSPSYDTRRAPLPLRILVVIATPIDMPQADMQQEQNAIREALDGLKAAGTIEYEFCTHATRQQFLGMVGDRFHVVHFIGHGAFDIVGDDTTPVPYICFENELTHESDPVDATLLRMQLLNTDVRLVVLTSCASAAPAPPDQEPYIHRAFDGIAQSLVGGPNGIPAVVAMQFDLESTAAVAFSKTFYDRLLRRGVDLDEAVTRARLAVASVPQIGAGHRAWVTPAVYWNCAGVPLFDLVPLRGPQLDPATADQLKLVEMELKILRGILQQIAAKTEQERQALAEMRADQLARIRELEEQRGQLIGDSLRIWGGDTQRGSTIDLRIELRLRLAETIGQIDFTLRFDPAKVRYVNALQAVDTQITPFVGAPGPPGEIRVLVPNASRGQQWPPGRFNLGLLRFEVDATADAITHLQMSNANVTENGQATPFTTLDPVILVE